jgi:hypothetical protein
MMQVLDYFRQLYKNETGYEISTDPTVAQRRFPPSYVLHNGVRELIGEYESHPTWEYVRWLESRLSKYEKELFETGIVTTAIYNPILNSLKESFPDHTFELKEDKGYLYIDGKKATMEWTHPDEASVNFAVHGEVPDQFATAEEYLKHELQEGVAKYLSLQGEKHEHVRSGDRRYY